YAVRSAEDRHHAAWTTAVVATCRDPESANARSKSSAPRTDGYSEDELCPANIEAHSSRSVTATLAPFLNDIPASANKLFLVERPFQDCTAGSFAVSGAPAEGTFTILSTPKL